MSAKVLYHYYGVLIVISCNMAKGSILNGDNFAIQSHVYDPEKHYGMYHRSAETTTECAPSALNATTIGSQGGGTTSQNADSPSKSGASNSTTVGSASTIPSDNSPSISATKLYALVQHIYAAQARVQLEVNEIKRAQAVANSAQKSLEEAANNVRVITSALQSAQQEVAGAAVRAQTAQMQLAAHDQLLFAARQKVDALSSQMVGLQAEDGVGTPKNLINLQDLLSQLKEPLSQNQTPTPIPPIDDAFNGKDGNSGEGKSAEAKGILDYDEFYKE